MIDAATRRQAITDVAATIRDNYPEEQRTGASSSPALRRHGLRTVRMLEHGTAYLEFDAPPGDSVAMRVVEDKLAALPEVRALVFDIRRNIGGSGDMVIMLCSHLLEEQSLLYRVYGRSGGSPGEVKATATRRHFAPAIPEYVLTSGATVSAAEAFAYVLQDYGRATLVGERTAGMANPSRTFSIGERFDLTVPFLLFRYGRSGGTFAGVGVAPNIAVPADSALDAALAEIENRSGSPGRSGSV
jgi:C-terminal processing protease CtpA/Prc